jgi:predicted pyridoxine 5'-phosphate oxidase superfamily flavin-nucleotide-binding protein
MSLEKALQQRYGSTRRADRFYEKQVISCLNEKMIEFVSRQEMMFVSTADGEGHCDSAIRVGNPGFVRVLNSQTIAYPEYRGNGVFASLGNIAENPHVGLLLVDFYDSTIGLHINGKASIVDDLKGCDDPPAERWVCVEVEEAYIQCSKYIPLLERKSQASTLSSDIEKPKSGDFFCVQGGDEQGDVANP